MPWETKEFRLRDLLCRLPWSQQQEHTLRTFRMVLKSVEQLSLPVYLILPFSSLPVADRRFTV